MWGTWEWSSGWKGGDVGKWGGGGSTTEVWEGRREELNTERSVGKDMLGG
jgi:hypothetical protein